MVLRGHEIDRLLYGGDGIRGCSWEYGGPISVIDAQACTLTTSYRDSGKMFEKPLDGGLNPCYNGYILKERGAQDGDRS